ncbi:MAG: YqiA/YcfP family alpha/beta fold hydrolase, partial [Polaromonas sp.]|nr:YqiA/YcfP family alpha/beta fold hydrolase [Polaromonas sp.]
AARDLAKYVGEQICWHDPDGRFFFEPRFIDELRALTHGPVARPENYFAVIAKGDEVLDWREMSGRYPGAQIRLLEGGDHAISGFELHLPEVMDFLGLS